MQLTDRQPGNTAKNKSRRTVPPDVSKRAKRPKRTAPNSANKQAKQTPKHGEDCKADKPVEDEDLSTLGRRKRADHLQP